MKRRFLMSEFVHLYICLGPEMLLWQHRGERTFNSFGVFSRHHPLSALIPKQISHSFTSPSFTIGRTGCHQPTATQGDAEPAVSTSQDQLRRHCILIRPALYCSRAEHPLTLTRKYNINVGCVLLYRPSHSSAVTRRPGYPCGT